MTEKRFTRLFYLLLAILCATSCAQCVIRGLRGEYDEFIWAALTGLCCFWNVARVTEWVKDEIE